MRKNLLSLLLALSLVLGCMPLTALAAESPPYDKSIPAAEDNTADQDEPSTAAEGSLAVEGEDKAPPTAEESEQTSDTEVPADGGTERIGDFATLAESDNIWGGIKWSLSQSGVLTISAAPGVANSGVMPSGQLESRQAPWLKKNVPIITLNIQEGVINIGDFIFCNDTVDRYPYLTTVTLPNSLTSIGSHAFYTAIGTARHSAIKSIHLPSNLERIGEKAFEGCTELTSEISIPGSCKTVGNSAFAYTSISGLNLSEGVEEIGMSAFVNCEDLIGDIALPSSIKSVGQWAFANCGAESVHINSTAGAEFGIQVFENSKNLKEVIIEPNSITEIPNNMFKGCKKIETVSLPEGIKSIGYSAFTECSALTEIVLPDSLLTIDENAFSSCTSLESITIPNKVREVAKGTFSSCSALETVVLGEQVLKVSSSAFLNDSPQNITLYYNLLIVDDGNFNGILPAMNVTFYGTEAEWAALCSRLKNNNRLTGATPTIIPIIHTTMEWNNDTETNVSVAEASEQRMPLKLRVERPVAEGITETSSISAIVAAYNGTGRMLGLFSSEVGQNGSVMDIRLPANTAYIKIIMVDDDSIAPLLPAKRIT